MVSGRAVSTLWLLYFPNDTGNRNLEDDDGLSDKRWNSREESAISIASQPFATTFLQRWKYTIAIESTNIHSYQKRYIYI